MRTHPFTPALQLSVRRGQLCGFAPYQVGTCTLYRVALRWGYRCRTAGVAFDTIHSAQNTKRCTHSYRLSVALAAAVRVLHGACIVLRTSRLFSRLPKPLRWTRSRCCLSPFSAANERSSSVSRRFECTHKDLASITPDCAITASPYTGSADIPQQRSDTYHCIYGNVWLANMSVFIFTPSATYLVSWRCLVRFRRLGNPEILYTCE